MAASRSSSEPSMEEILASIRRIIAEDGPNPDVRGTKSVTTDNQPQSQDKSPVLDLTEMLEEGATRQMGVPAAVLEIPAPQADPARPPVRDPRVADAKGDEASGALIRKPLPAPPVAEAEKPDAMVSPRAQAQAQQALAELRRAAELERAKAIENKRDTLGLEGLVLDALKPQLKAWLDQNLGPLVERIVREEVRRLVKQQTQA